MNKREDDRPPTADPAVSQYVDIAQGLGLHPIAGEALAMVDAAKIERGIVEFSDEAIEVLTERVVSMADDPELKQALISIWKLASYIEDDLDDRPSALKLMQAAEAGGPLLRDQNVEGGQSGALDEADRVGGALQDFSGREQVRAAPKHDGKKPKEGVSLKDLLPPRPLTGR